MATANNSAHSLPSVQKYTCASYQIWQSEDIIRKSPKYHSYFDYELCFSFLLFLKCHFGTCSSHFYRSPLVQTKQDTLLTLPLPNSNKIPTLRWQLSGPDIALPLATGRGSPGRRRSKVAKRQRRTAVDGVDRWVNISSNALFAQDTRLRHG